MLTSLQQLQTQNLTNMSDAPKKKGGGLTRPMKVNELILIENYSLNYDFKNSFSPNIVLIHRVKSIFFRFVGNLMIVNLSSCCVLIPIVCMDIYSHGKVKSYYNQTVRRYTNHLTLCLILFKIKQISKYIYPIYPLRKLRVWM